MDSSCSQPTSSTNQTNPIAKITHKKLLWNRETSQPGEYTHLPIVKEARILAVSDPEDKNNQNLYDPQKLPNGAKVVGIGTCIEDFQTMIRATTTTTTTTTDSSQPPAPEQQQQPPNVLFISSHKSNIKELIVELVQTFADSLEWIHSRSAGVDFFVSEELKKLLPSNPNNHVVVTNAKGMYSSTLAEFAMMACSYFAKDVPRLVSQKKEKKWFPYEVLELRKATFGIIGYGDIGKACAKLAKAYGMHVIACRRRRHCNSTLQQQQQQQQQESQTTTTTTESESGKKRKHNEEDDPSSTKDPYCDEFYHVSELHTLLNKSDYILISAPLTTETCKLINKEALQQIKQDAVIINVGRGPIIDEAALIEELLLPLRQDPDTNSNCSKVKGVALDVTAIEPLPHDSKLWEVGDDRVLISPHCMDKTKTFLKESTDFFIQENLPRFICNLDLYNHVDVVAGY